MYPITRGFLLVVLLQIVSVSNAQSKKRLQPGKMYSSGEVVYAPRYGFTSIVPQGWQGTLPRDMEIFLLVPDTITTGGEVFSFVSVDGNTDAIREAWVEGVNLSEEITIKAKNVVMTEGDMISTEVIASGRNVNRGSAGYAAARCSPFGHCITSLALGPVQFYDEMKLAVERFMTSATFSEPSHISIYADFNWKEFLSNKMLIAFMAMQDQSGSGTKDNRINLCRNGTFNAKIKKKGAMKQFNSEYSGNLSGRWSAEGIGEHGLLKLEFKKLPSVQVPLSIKEERIFANGERYFIAESYQCD
jgi:hypothetical protein